MTTKPGLRPVEIDPTASTRRRSFPQQTDNQTCADSADNQPSLVLHVRGFTFTGRPERPMDFCFINVPNHEPASWTTRSPIGGSPICPPWRIAPLASASLPLLRRKEWGLSHSSFTSREGLAGAWRLRRLHVYREAPCSTHHLTREALRPIHYLSREARRQTRHLSREVSSFMHHVNREVRFSHQCHYGLQQPHHL